MTKGWPEPVFDDEHDARAAEVRRVERWREKLRLAVQTRFPRCCAKAREVEEVFGCSVRIVWALEDGWAVGPVPAQEAARYEEKNGPLRHLPLRDPGHPDDPGG